MRGTRCLRGLAILGVALGGFVAPASTSGLFGIAPAKAERFYTRKRVNGQWITGLFPAEDTAPTRHKSRPRVTARAKPAAAAALGAAAGTIAAKPDTAPVAEAANDVDGATPPGRSPRTEWAFAPAPEPVAPIAVHAIAPVDVPSPPSAEDRMSRLRSALLARAQDLAGKDLAGKDLAGKDVTGKDVTGKDVTGKDAAPGDVARTDSIPTAAEAKKAEAPEPRSVSYDFESGVKTTVFATSVVREPFDVASMKRITAPVR